MNFCYENVFDMLSKALVYIHITKMHPFPDADDPYKLTDETRKLGLTVCRGTAVVLICPLDGMEAISNPFLQQEA